ncbi:hypothetical protein [Paenibacillus foliorum]|uniref:hypothetical protein n=1 Tax=Paenibacillus foliorum TaxID=2654974 RepID=UPI001C118450|nr:hypothetical protein [Paenibacillus foliorum]
MIERKKVIYRNQQIYGDSMRFASKHPLIQLHTPNNLENRYSSLIKTTLRSITSAEYEVSLVVREDNAENAVSYTLMVEN